MGYYAHPGRQEESRGLAETQGWAGVTQTKKNF